MEGTLPKSTYCEPTVLWRLRRSATDTARATVVPHWQYATVLWWINERLEGAVNCASLHDAIREGERVRDVLVEDGWWTDEGPPL
jgi:hypothetical protein